MASKRFRDRAEAGRLLAELLRDYVGRENVVVLALPRGGVPVGYEVAKALGAPLGVVAVPVAAEETCDEFRDIVDEIVCGVTPRPFHAVGLWYDDFSQTSDEEVRELLADAAEHAEARG